MSYKSNQRLSLSPSSSRHPKRSDNLCNYFFFHHRVLSCISFIIVFYVYFSWDIKWYCSLCCSIRFFIFRFKLRSLIFRILFILFFLFHISFLSLVRWVCFFFPFFLPVLFSATCFSFLIFNRLFFSPLNYSYLIHS